MYAIHTENLQLNSSDVQNELGAFVIHPGLPKCASSYLKRLLSDIDGCSVIVPRKLQLKMLRGDKADGIRYLEELERRRVNSGSQAIVLSNEGMLGGGFFPETRDFTVLDSILSLSPDSKILILIRSQPNYIKSAYKYSIRSGQRLPDFKKFVVNNKSAISSALCYHNLISELHHRFGCSRVLVVLAEQLQREPEKYETLIVEYLGLTLGSTETGPDYENKSPESDRALNFIRIGNFVLFPLAKLERWLHTPKDDRIVTNPNRGVYKWYVRSIEKVFYLLSQIITSKSDTGTIVDIAEICPELIDDFERSNARLGKVLKLDLQKYNYPSEKS